ncbi:MAG TPA: lytic transglycosylase domain-containing protein [Candidatus Dormibacteraeota bacterium]
MPIRRLPAALATLLAALALSACSQAAADSQAAGYAPLAQVAPPAAAGQAVAVPTPSVEPVLAADRPTVKWLLYQAAARHQINAGLVMGLAWYESGWNQAAISPTGAIGVMQVEPYMASAGPVLLGHPADPNKLADNIDLGAAILKEDLDRYNNDLIKALVAYNSGPGAVVDWAKLDPGHQAYVLGIYNLAVAFDKGAGPA